MKKKLLALAVAGAFVAPVAMADSGNVTIYGQVNASVVMGDAGDQKSATVPAACGTPNPNCSGATSTRISSDQSRLGLKGTEDLGGGTSAIWQIESSIGADSGSGTLAARNTFVGLAGESWGDIKLGNMDSPYKSATRGYDVFGDTVADNRSILGQYGLTAATGATVGSLDARNNSSLTYTSPDLSGFKVSAQYVAAAENASVSGDNKGSNYSLSAAYNAGPVSAAGALVQMKKGSGCTASATTGCFPTITNSVNDDKIRGLRLGGGYKMDAITVNAVFERVTSDITGATLTRSDTLRANTFYVGGKFAVSGSDAVKLAYTRRGEIGATKVANSKVTQISLGYDHAMSKRTTVYALYSKLNNDNASALGMSQASSDTVSARGAGADPSAIAFGVKHSF